MMAVLGLDHYSSSEAMWILAFSVVGAVIAGYVTDLLMGQRGFGPFGNGFLIAFGALVGIHYRNFVFGPMLMHDTFAIGLSAACAAAAILLGLGVARHWLQD